jgi:hypothetical protein
MNDVLEYHFATVWSGENECTASVNGGCTINSRDDVGTGCGRIVGEARFIDW